MKLTILKKWMVTLAIICLYFNIGIQATEEENQREAMKKDRDAKKVMYWEKTGGDDFDLKNKTSKIDEDMKSTRKNETSTPTQDLKPTGKIVSKMTRDETNKFLIYNLAYSTYLTKRLKECQAKDSEDLIAKRNCFFWLDELKNELIEEIDQDKIQEQKQLIKKQKLATTSGTEKKSFFSCCCPSKKETITYKKK